MPKPPERPAASIHTNFVREWVMGGMKETPEQIAEMISRLAQERPERSVS
ncbi:MAG: TetR family transcriptional regulator C-terminal domain-containing protein [Clostridiales Family XIII bacterium]|jgi:hypothetical protein|nr:TetR family transcriptional regulator C-terminal domain-containing protein [Clostridiales Family XIII bacterium]